MKKEITLETNGYSEFYLREKSCRDHRYTATRKAVADAIKAYCIHNEASVHIRLISKGTGGFVRSLNVSLRFERGRLRMGCHLFDQTTTKVVLKWAGIKEMEKRNDIRS